MHLLWREARVAKRTCSVNIQPWGSQFGLQANYSHCKGQICFHDNQLISKSILYFMWWHLVWRGYCSQAYCVELAPNSAIFSWFLAEPQNIRWARHTLTDTEGVSEFLSSLQSSGWLQPKEKRQRTQGEKTKVKIASFFSAVVRFFLQNAQMYVSANSRWDKKIFSCYDRHKISTKTKVLIFRLTCGAEEEII